MKLQDLQTKVLKSEVITVRTTKIKSDWLKEHNVSPSKLFNGALEELMNQDNKNEQEVKTNG